MKRQLKSLTNLKVTKKHPQIQAPKTARNGPMNVPRLFFPRDIGIPRWNAQIDVPIALKDVIVYDL